MGSLASLKKLFPYLRPHSKLILGSVLLAIPLAGIRVGPAPFIRYMLDDFLARKDTSKILLLPTFLIGLYVLNMIVRFGHYFLLRVVIIRVNQKLKNDLFNHFLGLSADHFTKQSTGALISRSTLDPAAIDGGLATINIIVREPITLISLFSYALYLNWRLTLITLIIAPVLAWLFAVTGKNLKRYISKIGDIHADLCSTLQESFTGIRIIKAFGLEKYIFKKFRQQNAECATLFLKTSALEEFSHPLVELLTAFALSPVIYYGGLQVVVGKMTTGDLLAFFATFALMMNPIRMMNDVNIKLSQAAGACDRIFDALSWKSNLHEPQNPQPCKNFQKSIEICDVSFAYPDARDRNILQDLTFSIPKGHAVAIVGPSGSGKSSLASLIPRIFDVTGGSIQIDGQDIREIALNDLRKMIAVVSQDIFLFNDTIEENIRCGSLSATPEQIREAAKRAHAFEFIEKLSEGFKTRIGDRGQKLSGGERQRLSIARAFLREAPILILDEATSNLDTASERAVQGALDELMLNRTTLIIAHRLSTVRNANSILVLKTGKIVEKGTHEDLIRHDGEYARFHRIPVH